MNIPSVTKSIESWDWDSSTDSGPTPVMTSSDVTHDPDPDPDPELVTVLISAVSGSIGILGKQGSTRLRGESELWLFVIITPCVTSVGFLSLDEF